MGKTGRKPRKSTSPATKSIYRRRAQKKARNFGGQHSEPAQDDEIAQLRTKIVELEAKLKSAYAPRVTRSFIALGSPAAAFSKFAHKPKPMRLGKRAANRNPTQIVREADINLCLRYQELLSYRTMRRIRKAAALSNGMVHSTGFGLSTEENVGLATQRACAKVIERGIKMVITNPVFNLIRLNLLQSHLYVCMHMLMEFVASYSIVSIIPAISEHC